MKNVPLGASALTVPPICLGTMTFGEQVDEATAHSILDRSMERGINFLDAAEMYSVPARAETCGATETILGNWFAKDANLRSKVVLATKVAGPSRGMPWIRGENSGVSKAEILKACDDSLRRLNRGPTVPDNLAQLAGWRIDVGPAGGGSAPLFRQLAAANGLPGEGLVQGDGAAVNRVVALVLGQVDALALVSAPDAPLLQYLLATPGVRLFDFAQAEAYARRFPFLRPLVLPRGVIDLAADQPPQDLRLVAASTQLVAQADLHPALVQLLLQAAQQAHGEAGWFHRAGEFPNAQVVGLSLAAEAARYHRSGPPWLQRYLPFWLANFGDRMWIVLLPLLAALVPLSRIVPPLVTLRLRSRVYRWYAHLRAVEQALEQPDPDLVQLRAELEHIDAQTEHIGLPLSFTNELYDLRAHIHLVRKRLLARAAGGAGPTGQPAAP